MFINLAVVLVQVVQYFCRFAVVVVLVLVVLRITAVDRLNAARGWQ